jgi:acetyl esterase
MIPTSGTPEPACTIEPWQTPLGDFAERSIFLTIDGTQLSIFIFRPESPRRKNPAIIFFHGGGWRGGGPGQFFSHARYFASRGIVSFSVQYRLHEQPDDTNPAQAVERAKCAYRWVQDHALTLGIDPARVVVSGSSAGGHLAAAVALLPETDGKPPVSPGPAAIVLFNPVTDTTSRGYHPGGFEGMNPTLDSLSVSEPHLISPNTPPTLIFHPVADTTVAFKNSSRFRDLLLHAGVNCQLVGVQDVGHGYIYAGTTSPQAVESIRLMDCFLRDLGFLQGDPTITFHEPRDN